MGAIKDAARALIQYEYQFRFGRRAYQNEPTARYEQALENLYKSVTGEEDLTKAYQVLQQEGAIIPEGDCAEPIEEPKPATKSLPRPQLKKGFFQ